MRVRRVLRLEPIAAGLLLVAGAAFASTPPSAADPGTWTARRAEWIREKRAYEAVRWGGPLDEILPVLDREAAAESAYIAALEPWCADAGARAPAPATPASRATLRSATLDLVERGRLDAALRVLDAPLRGDRELLPVRARAYGLRTAPDSGLAILCWPPDRRVVGTRAIAWDAQGRAPGEGTDAAYVVAAALSDSCGKRRGERAALWRLLQASRPATRSYARVRLAQSLLDRGETRLVTALLERAYGIDDDEELLLANLRADLAASLGDTLRGIPVLINAATSTQMGTAQRYAAARRAASWTRGQRADSLSEQDWLSLVKTLGDVGEAASGLALFKQRRIAAPDSAAALARAETEAALFAKLKRNQDAAAAYGKLLARADLPAASRAKYALGLARARRGLGDFPGMDSAFVLAAALDPGSGTASTAAWERAREWEDRKPPRETAEIYTWAIARMRDARLLDAAVVHRAIAWLRAGEPDSAAAGLEGAPGDAAHYWLAQVDAERGDSTAALREYRLVNLGDPWTYEGARAREELERVGVDRGLVPGAAGSPLVVSSRATQLATAGDGDPPLNARLLGAVGAPSLMTDALRDCSQREDDPGARDCTEALEDLGIFRVGRRSNVPWPRLEYPPAYANAVAGAAARESLSAALLWSIMRQESGYLAPARSKAGAIGLLQLLPTTASMLNKAPVTEGALTDPALNVRLGARYVRNLAREFKDPRAVIAAYNAGEDAVRRWLHDRPRVDDVWVEMIPYRETRDYVKQVYAAWRRYEAIYGPGSAAKD